MESKQILHQTTLVSGIGMGKVSHARDSHESRVTSHAENTKENVTPGDRVTPVRD